MAQGSAAGSSNIKIITAGGIIDNNMYLVSANISYQLGNENQEALEHGIPLEFDTVIRIMEPRPWFWDRLIIMKVVSYRLEYQPLSGDYLVTRLNDGELEQFQELEDALIYIGELRKFPITEATALESGNNGTYAQIKSRLNIETLPAPLRPLAYISTDWRLSSPWHNWSVTR